MAVQVEITPIMARNSVGVNTWFILLFCFSDTPRANALFLLKFFCRLAGRFGPDVIGEDPKSACGGAEVEVTHREKR